MSNISIRKSTDQDLTEIHSWLVQQTKDNIHGTFLCNWNLTQKCHEEGRLIVAIDSSNNEVIAYQWGGLKFPGILEVRNDKRGLGIGRKIVEYCIEQASNEGVNALHIQCTPESSRPFWEHMGFIVYDEDDRHAYKMIDHFQCSCPQSANTISVRIRFFPEFSIWKEDTPHISEYNPTVWKSDHGVLQLEKRISVFTELNDWAGDPVVEVCIGDKQIYIGKAKHNGAEDLGFICEYGSIYIDQMWLPQHESDKLD